MDKILIISPVASDNIKSLSENEQRDKESIAVNYEDLKDHYILGYLFSQSYRLIVFNMLDDYYNNTVELLLDMTENVILNHEGTQGRRLLELLIEMYPSNTAAFRKAFLSRKDLFEVIV